MLDGRQHLLLIPLTLVLGIAIYRMQNDNKKLWLSMLGIGLMAGIVFVTEPHWTPSSLLKSISVSIWLNDESSWPELPRFYLIAALLAGMISASVVGKTFDLRGFRFSGLVRHSCAGILMGCGAVIANGGNDTQLLVAMPALSLAGYTAVFSIILGIYIGLKISKSTG
ncbi:YeeE/YedE thiosulfate transporter family protein [Vibrio sp. CDRSL-10 TSBA]